MGIKQNYASTILYNAGCTDSMASIEVVVIITNALERITIMATANKVIKTKNV
jgi:hypothetical protein